jgi:hypothetical protein
MAATNMHGASRRSKASKRRHRWMAMYVAGALLRDRSVRQGLFLGAITLGALAHLAREKQADNRERLATWWNALPARPSSNGQGGPAHG